MGFSIYETWTLQLDQRIERKCGNAENKANNLLNDPTFNVQFSASLNVRQTSVGLGHNTYSFQTQQLEKNKRQAEAE